jgi:hypothetical protein
VPTNQGTSMLATQAVLNLTLYDMISSQWGFFPRGNPAPIW